MPFPTGYYWITGKSDLNQFREVANTQQLIANYSLSEAKSGDVFVLSGRYLAYFSDYKIPIHFREVNVKRFLLDGTEVTDQHAMADWVERLDDFVRRAARKKVNVVLMLPFPEFPYSGPQCISFFTRINPLSLCTQSKEGLRARSKAFTMAVEKVARAHKNLYLFDPMDSLCPEIVNCRTTDGNGRLLYYDATHLSAHGARILSESFIKFLQEKNQSDGLVD